MKKTDSTKLIKQYGELKAAYAELDTAQTSLQIGRNLGDKKLEKDIADITRRLEDIVHRVSTKVDKAGKKLKLPTSTF